MPAYRKGQYVVCRFNGSRNGDLIVGVIDSVRKNGKIVLTNLITGKTSTKGIETFAKRNVIVPRKAALQVVQHAKSINKVDARKLAVGFAKKYRNGLHEKPAKPEKNDPVKQIITLFRSLNDAQKQAVSRKLWGPVLEVFGVD